MNPSGHEFHSLTEALYRMGLAEERRPPRFTPLAGGVSSLILLAETDRALFCVKQALPRLKVAREWYAPVAGNRAEVAWLRVASQLVPDRVPRVLGEDAQTRSFAMKCLDPACAERRAAWNEVLRIAAEIGDGARFTGREALRFVAPLQWSIIGRSGAPKQGMGLVPA